jgi:hypothetical protein
MRSASASSRKGQAADYPARSRTSIAVAAILVFIVGPILTLLARRGIAPEIWFSEDTSHIIVLSWCGMIADGARARRRECRLLND